MAYRGGYPGVDVRPGTPLEHLLLMAQNRLESARVQRVLVQVLAATGAEGLGRAYQRFLHLSSPQTAAAGEAQEEAMRHLLSSWDRQVGRFQAAILPGLLKARQQRPTRP